MNRMEQNGVLEVDNTRKKPAAMKAGQQTPSRSNLEEAKSSYKLQRVTQRPVKLLL